MTFHMLGRGRGPEGPSGELEPPNEVEQVHPAEEGAQLKTRRQAFCSGRREYRLAQPIWVSLGPLHPSRQNLQHVPYYSIVTCDLISEHRVI